MPRFKISSRHEIGDGAPCYVVAEIGQNHQGDVNIAKKMIAEAKRCGADCVKFQKSHLPAKFNKNALLRPYMSKNSWGTTYGEHKKFLEFSEEQYSCLQKYAEQVVDIDFTASAMDLVSLDFLSNMRVPFIKVPSNDTCNFPYIEHACTKRLPLVISSGMQTLDTMRKVYEIVESSGVPFAFLQCTSCYPALPESINLNVLHTYRMEFPKAVLGYSGHELGISVSLAAVALGAKILERHFTLDKCMKGSDHGCSLDPCELETLVREVRVVEQALGSYEKVLQPCEMACNHKLGKSLVARQHIARGARITAELVSVKVAEPKGILPERLSDIIGKTAACSIEEDDAILEDFLQ